ncbi:TIM barrel protein, partial [Salmonella enterica]|uniref:TIM barrel protein n=1 Tax=Salmonella enterica TaxID=28901 RepID=UPI00398C40DD
EQGLRVLVTAIEVAQYVGVPVNKRAGCDGYFRHANDDTVCRVRDGLKESVDMAGRAQVTLAMEIMDYPLMTSISKALGYAHYLNNPCFLLYPAFCNLSAWDNFFQLEIPAECWPFCPARAQITKTDLVQNVPLFQWLVHFL